MEQQEAEFSQANGTKTDYSKMTKAELKDICESLTSENEEMKAVCEQAKAETEQAKQVAIRAAEFQTMYTRLKADFDNFKRRNADIMEKSKEEAVSSLAERILPVLDNFGRAVASIKDENVSTGIKMICQQLVDVLGNMGIKKYESLGEVFDHNLHDAVMMQDADPEQEGKVIAVIQEGYYCGEKVLRAAKVIVGKLPDAE